MLDLVIVLKIKEAVVLRLKKICSERNYTLYKISTLSGVSYKSVYSLERSDRKDMSLSLLKKIVDGLDMTMAEFFDDEIFDETELEIE